MCTQNTYTLLCTRARTLLFTVAVAMATETEDATPITAYYNPRPVERVPEPRVEVQEVAGLTGARTRVRVLFGTEGASSLSSVFTLCNSAIGAGVLSLPYAFQCAGATAAHASGTSRGPCACTTPALHLRAPWCLVRRSAWLLVAVRWCGGSRSLHHVRFGKVCRAL